MDVDVAKQRAEQARQFLDDPFVKETFDAVRDAILSAQRSCKTESEAYKAVIAMQIYEQIKGAFDAHLETAKVVEFNYRNNKSFLDRLSGR